MNILKQPEKMITWFAVAMIPVVTIVSILAGNGLVTAPLISSLFAGAGIFALTRPTPSKPVIGLALIGQAIALTAAFSGHPWQIDSHMVFFAFLAMLISLIHVPTILVATAAIALHHLGLTISLPVLVYPSADLIGNLERTVIHAIVVVAESAALIVTIRRLQALARESADHLAEVAEATSVAEEARDQAIAAKTDADMQRAEAENARTQAEATLESLEEKQRQAMAADLRAKEIEKSEKLAAEQRQIEQQQVVETLGHGLKALAEGDLSVALHDAFSDDYENLRLDFNRAVGALSLALQEVSAHADQMRSDSGQISEAAVALSKRAEHQAGRLEETAASMEEVTSIVHKTAQNATEAATSVAGARASTEESGQVVARASEAMSEIDSSAAEINSIIDVIDQIAFQTNLLALNAGVEAARAGDAGRGFAVVASEVRALAQRSSEAAKDISGLIVKSQGQVKDGVRFVGETVDALKAVSDSVNEISGRVDEIAASASEQATALDDINTAVVEIDSVTQQNTAMIEETAAAAQTLVAASDQMQGLIGRFQHQDRSAPPARSGRAA